MAHPSKNIHARTPQKAFKFAEDGGAPQAIQLLKVGAFNHPFYGLMRITPQTLAEMVANVASDVRKQKLPVDYGHDDGGKAAGWMKRVYTEDGGNTLWAEVEWTPAAKQGIADKEWCYFSSDFYFQWEDPETGALYENVLNGGGLTNRPFIKGMQAVAQFSEKGDGAVMLSEVNEGDLDSMKTQAELTQENVQLSEKVKGFEGQLETLKKQLSERDTEVSTLKAAAAKAKIDQELADKKAKFAELCRTGKAVAAQEEAYLAGDVVKFAELAGKPANVSGAGNGAGSTEVPGAIVNGTYVLSESDKAAADALGLSYEDFAKYNS